MRSDVSLHVYKAPQAAAISPFFISPTHATHTWRDRQPHREPRSLLFLTSAWVLKYPLLTCNTEDAGDGAYGLKSLSEKSYAHGTP